MADLHLCGSAPSKTMEVFDGWENYINRIHDNWKKIIKPEDTVVIPGDISWAMKLKDVYEDFKFINELPGEKVIIKGNHDYWWNSRKKMDEYVRDNGFSTIHFVFNDCYPCENGYAVCGTRGWTNMPGEQSDDLLQKREAQRLDVSLKAAEEKSLIPLVFLHYPPVYSGAVNENIFEILEKHNIKKCWYGHIHGRNAHRTAVQGEFRGIDFKLVAGDYLQFYPYRIL